MQLLLERVISSIIACQQFNPDDLDPYTLGGMIRNALRK